MELRTLTLVHAVQVIQREKMGLSPTVPRILFLPFGECCTENISVECLVRTTD